ncbi:MAG TPA: hypothetical protein VKV27_16620 [Solirubrobacteraceae bacterium]|nr:hypothetical protein [Solirubrobacteraceae bacterium]
MRVARAQTRTAAERSHVVGRGPSANVDGRLAQATSASHGTSPAHMRVYRARGLRAFGLPAIVCALALVAYGGYVRHWAWLGINGTTATLWDWLHLVLMPAAIVLLPAVGRAHGVRPGTGAVIAALGVGGAFVAAAYVIPLRWTGFAGNTLWDWLHLLLAPAAVALIPSVLSGRSPLPRPVLLIGASALALAILGGYALGWRWTGFAGNTAWDWMRLLALPVAVPVGLRLYVANSRDSGRLAR